MMTAIVIILALGIASQIIEPRINKEAVKEFVIRHLGETPADEK